MREKIAVLMGGRSLEREVSLASGRRVADALTAAGYRVLALDVTADLVATLRAERPDAAYIALHGKYGEDGTIQELLEFLGIPYSGPGVVASALAWDKSVAKHLFAEKGIPTTANKLPVQATEVMGLFIPDLLEVQAAPSVVVNTWPLSPTATITVPEEKMEWRLSVEPVFQLVQVSPLVLEFRAMPLSPTVTKVEPCNTTDRKGRVVPEGRVDQEAPSLDVITAPLSPTATN